MLSRFVAQSRQVLVLVLEGVLRGIIEGTPPPPQIIPIQAFSIIILQKAINNPVNQLILSLLQVYNSVLTITFWDLQC